MSGKLLHVRMCLPLSLANRMIYLLHGRSRVCINLSGHCGSKCLCSMQRCNCASLH